MGLVASLGRMGGFMNEQIKEFAEQADIKYKTDIFYSQFCDGVYEDDLTKFAMLIIRECAKVADLADENKCESIGGNILTYFGVKE